MAQQDGKTESGDGLASIHPSYLEDTRRRVTLIEKFLAGDRSRTSLVETAEAIGLSPSRTGRLIRSYELHRDPKLISGDGRRKSRSASTNERDVVRQAIDATISSLGTTADARDIEQAVASACEEASVAPPSTQLIWKSLAKARRANREPKETIAIRKAELIEPRAYKFTLRYEVEDVLDLAAKYVSITELMRRSEQVKKVVVRKLNEANVKARSCLWDRGTAEAVIMPISILRD